VGRERTGRTGVQVTATQDRLVAHERECRRADSQDLGWFEALEVARENATGDVGETRGSQPLPAAATRHRDLEGARRTVVTNDVVRTLAVQVGDQDMLETVRQAAIERLPWRVAAIRHRPLAVLHGDHVGDAMSAEVAELELAQRKAGALQRGPAEHTG